MKNIYIALAVVVFVVSAVVGGVWYQYQDNDERAISKLFIGNVPGVTAEDISMCDSSYISGGKYYRHLGSASLTCSRNHISVDYDHASDK